MSTEVVLVVATTADYIETIRRHHPGRALFLTHRPVREGADGPAPPPGAELVCDLDRCPDPTALILQHLEWWSLHLVGVTCFDCESLPLTAMLARRLGLPFPSPEAVAACRSKAVAKEIWEAHGLPCPRGRPVHSLDDLLSFRAQVAGPVILKPTMGSGSEGVYVCDSEAQLRSAYAAITDRLTAMQKARRDPRFCTGISSRNYRIAILAEERVRGEEYSCDFLLDDSGVTPIRFARKEIRDRPVPGTALAYQVPAALPEEVDRQDLLQQLGEAARSLGLRRALVMADFIFQDRRALMLELAPRPGGDCLPPLIRCSCGLDMLGLALDFAAGRPLAIPPPEAWRPLVGWRILADRAGTLLRLEAPPGPADPRVLDCCFLKKAGDPVTLPPADYDSWVLGHLVFSPEPGVPVAEQGRELVSRLRVVIEADPQEDARNPAQPIPRQVLENFVMPFIERRRSFLAAAETHGSPLYLLEPGVLTARVRRLTRAFGRIPGPVRIFYAVKSNDHPQVVGKLVSLGLGLDVSSHKELSLALELGVRRIVFTGPGKTDADLGLALDHPGRVTINMDSFGELERLQRLAASRRVCAQVGVRLADPQHGLWQRFGIALAALPDFLSAAASRPVVQVRGIHFHVSWQLTPRRLTDFIMRLGGALSGLAEEQRRELRYLDIGGGFWPARGEWLQAPDGGCPRQQTPLETRCSHYHRRGTPIGQFAKAVGEALETWIAPWATMETWLEPGRWLCSDAMHILLHVVDKKGAEMVITDGATHAIGREQQDADYMPIINLSRPGAEEHPCNIHGPQCTPHDVWGYSYWGAAIEPGDYLLVPEQGAYTYSLRQEFIRELPATARVLPTREKVVP